MAKKETPMQKAQLRDALGMQDKEPAPISFRQHLATSPTGLSNDDIQDFKIQDEAKAEEPGPSHWDILKSSLHNDNTLKELLTETPEFPIDLDFNGATYWKESESRITNMPGIDVNEVMDDVAGASSAAEAEHWLRKHEETFSHEQLLNDAGMKGMLTRMAVSILDPVDMAIAVATGGPLAAVMKGRKFGKIITGALSAGAATGGTEAYLASNNASRDETDVAIATLFGLGLGGGIGAIISKVDAIKLDNLKADMAADQLDSAKNHAEGGVDSAGAQRRASESLEPEKGLAGPGTTDIVENMKAGDEVEFSFKGLNKLFQTLQSTTFYSPSALVRKVTSRMVEGGLLKNQKGVRSRTAEGTANLIRRTFETSVFRDSLPMFRAWAKENKVGSVRRNMGHQAGSDFYSEVGRAMRGEVGDDISSHAQDAAKALRKHMDELYSYAENAGVKGFAEKGGLDDYFPRMLNEGKFEGMRNKYGSEALGDWFGRNIENSNPDMPVEIAHRIGKAYVAGARRSIAGQQRELMTGIKLDDIDSMREMFEGYEHLEELLGELEQLKKAEASDRGTVSFGKRRINFDETVAYPIRVDGEDAVELKFHEFYENDARKVLKRYGHSMSGHIGLAREMGVKSRDDFETLKKEMLREATADKTRNMDEFKNEMEALDTQYDLIIGRNTMDDNPTGDLSIMARSWTGYTYSTRGGQFGVNALAEVGRVIGAAGIRSFMRSMPEWASMMKRGQNGEIEHDFARTVEMMFAPGINGLTGVAIKNMDEFGESLNGSSIAAKVAQKTDGPLRTAGRVVSTGSGLNLLTDLPQRIAAVEMLRKFARFANGKKISPGQEARIRNMGISEEMQERIFAQLRKGGAGKYKGNRLIDIDPAKWVDTEAQDALNFGLNREVRSIIQENDIASVTKYFHHPLGRMLMQFMRFPMEAVNKQLAHSLHFADAESVKGFTSGLFIAGTAYIAQTSIDYANNPEELKKRLTPENIAKVAFMRSGVASMMPQMIDSAFPVLGGKHVAEAYPDNPWVNDDGKLFSYGRSSGSPTGAAVGNPTFDTIDKASSGVGNILHAITSDKQQVRSKDIKDVSKLLPGYRFLGVNNAIDAIANQFPESKEQ